MIHDTRTIDLKQERGLTLVEVMVVAILLAIIGTAGSILFVAGQRTWGLVDTQVGLQDNMRTLLQRLNIELQESGEDAGGVHQVTISDNTGTGGSDVLRFAVPICPCGVNPMNANSDVLYWGAPMDWGQSGCHGAYTLEASGDVAICHYVSPGNTQNMEVAPNMVKVHLAHGDYLGACNACTPANYTNRYVQYLIDANNQLLRRVLNPALSVLSTDVFAENVSDFQVSLNADSSVATVTVVVNGTTIDQRPVSMTGNMNVKLRNMNP
jgi:prepilin-type N-terminal cleavage/methylation domain-containing protein